MTDYFRSSDIDLIDYLVWDTVSGLSAQMSGRNKGREFGSLKLCDRYLATKRCLNIERGCRGIFKIFEFFSF